MLPQTAMFIEKQYKAETQSGEALTFELCKGGYFSTKEECGLKVVGKTHQDNLSGKNLFNINNREFVGGNWTNDESKAYLGIARNQTVTHPDRITSYSLENDILTFTGNYSWFGIGFPVLVEPNTTYTISALKTVDVDVNSYTAVAFYDENLNNMSQKVVGNNKLLTFTTPENCVCINLQFCCGDAPYTLTVSNIQLEKGSTPTTYEPYCGGIPAPNPDYPMPMQCVKAGTKVICGECTITTPCDLYEGDIWYPMSGKVIKNNEKIIFDGTESSWRYQSQSSNEYAKMINIVAILGGGKDGSDTVIYTNYYKQDTNADLSVESFLCRLDSSGGCLCIADFRDLDLFKSQLRAWHDEGNPLTLVYQKKNPIIEQYEPQPIFAPQGTVNVSQEQLELSADLEATMLVRRTER